MFLYLFIGNMYVYLFIYTHSYFHPLGLARRLYNTNTRRTTACSVGTSISQHYFWTFLLAPLLQLVAMNEETHYKCQVQSRRIIKYLIVWHRSYEVYICQKCPKQSESFS